jgi:hypothetical protein
MIDLIRHPKLRQIARDLHIPDSEDALRDIREHAIETVRAMLREWTLETIDDLRRLVSDRLSVKLEFIRSDEDVSRLASEYQHFFVRFRRLLYQEFITGDTEGLLIDNPSPNKGGRRYLAIIDARGARAARAYFTAWHELAHLLLCPPRQMLFDGFRRTPTDMLKRKDPLESAVDHIAGLLAFWEPIFKPALCEAAAGELRFSTIEAASEIVAPGASLYAASLAAIRLWDGPAIFLTAEEATKTDGTGFALRVQTLIPNDLARSPNLRIRKSMRVPTKSFLFQTFHENLGFERAASENQEIWEVSGHGNLPPLHWKVQSLRRGPAVYGILKPLQHPPVEEYSGTRFASKN